MHCKVIFYLLDKANVLIQSAILGTMRFTHYVHMTPQSFSKEIANKGKSYLILMGNALGPSPSGTIS